MLENLAWIRRVFRRRVTQDFGVAAAFTAVALFVGIFIVVGDNDDSSDRADPSIDSALRLSADEAEIVVRDYLAALADEDYEAAAALLAGGDEPLDQRSDLAVLQVGELSVEALTEALAGYCGDGGCISPTSVSLAVRELPDVGYVATVEFGEPRGHPLHRPFVVWATPEGHPYVHGLPPAELSPIPPGPDL